MIKKIIGDIKKIDFDVEIISKKDKEELDELFRILKKNKTK